MRVRIESTEMEYTQRESLGEITTAMTLLQNELRRFSLYLLKYYLLSIKNTLGFGQS